MAKSQRKALFPSVLRVSPPAMAAPGPVTWSTAEHRRCTSSLLGRRGLHRQRRLRSGLRLAYRFDRVEPGLRRLLACGAGLWIELVNDVIKLKIGLTAGARDQTPFGCFDEIARRAAATCQNARQAILGDRAAAHGGFAKQRGCGLLIAIDAFAVKQRDAIFHLRIGIVGQYRFRPPLRRLPRILRHATTSLVKGAERILRVGAAALSRDAQEFGGAAKILRKHLPFDIEQSEIVGGKRMTELGGSRKPSRARVTIARPGSAIEGKHGEREHRIAVAARRGEPIPFGGAPIVLRHA